MVKLEKLKAPGDISMKEYIQNRDNFDRIKSGLTRGWGQDISDIETINYISNYDSIPAGCTDIEGFYEAYAKWRKSGDTEKPNELLQFYQEGGMRLKKYKKKRKHRKRSKKISKKSHKKRRKHRKRTKRR